MTHYGLEIWIAALVLFFLPLFFMPQLSSVLAKWALTSPDSCKSHRCALKIQYLLLPFPCQQPFPLACLCRTHKHTNSQVGEAAPKPQCQQIYQPETWSRLCLFYSSHNTYRHHDPFRGGACLSCHYELPILAVPEKVPRGIRGFVNYGHLVQNSPRPNFFPEFGL